MDEYFVEEKSSWDKILDFLVFIAVFAVTIFLILGIVASSGVEGLDIVAINNIYFYVNIVVFIIFSLDLVRLWNRSENAKDFFTHHWLDVLATIPFGIIAGMLSATAASNPTFEVLKWFRVTKVSGIARVQRLSRISKISKEFKAASHLKKEGEEYQKKHRL